MKKRKNGILFTVPVIISIVVLVVILVISIMAPVFTRYDPDAIDFMSIKTAPSMEHWLGTDATGRDQFTRLLYGGRTSIVNAFLVVLIATAVGVPLGLICGYYQGIVDVILMRIADFILAFPLLLLAIILVAGFGRSGTIAVIAAGIVYVPGIIKLVRSLVMVEKKTGYVEACESLCYSDKRILFFHILPNCIPVLTSQLTLDFGYAIITLTSMSFLGIGVQAPQADWGTMLQEGFVDIFNYPWLSLGPGLVIILVVVAVNVLSDGIQMYLDPSQRKLPSFKQYRKKQKKTIVEI